MSTQSFDLKRKKLMQQVGWFGLLAGILIAINRAISTLLWTPFLKVGAAHFCNLIKTSGLSCSAGQGRINVKTEALSLCIGPQFLGTNGLLFFLFIVGSAYIFSSSFRQSKLIGKVFLFGIPFIILLTALRVAALSGVFSFYKDAYFRATYANVLKILLFQSGAYIYGLGMLFFVIYFRLKILKTNAFSLAK